jgi:hypothetical protein
MPQQVVEVGPEASVLQRRDQGAEDIGDGEDKGRQ